MKGLSTRSKSTGLSTTGQHKPIVNYRPSNVGIIRVGFYAYIYPINHPSDLVSNTKLAKTSTVIAITSDGFETENTIYKEIK